MSRTFARRASWIGVGAALVIGLSGCSADSAELSGVGEASSPQSVAAACGIGTDQVDALLDEVADRLVDARDEVAAGNIPDVAELSAGLTDRFDGLADSVTNSEVAAAIEDLRASVRGFDDIEAPDSILGAPAYLASLASQVRAVNDAGTALSELCQAQPSE